jgi:glutathione S-transferase
LKIQSSISLLRRFLDINPRGKVPAIQNTEDGFIIYESAICDEYLSEVARQLENSHLDGTTVWKLMPVDPSDRAALRLLNDIVDTQMGTSMFTFLMNKDATKDPDFIESLENALTMLQESLVTRGGPYLMGGEFTLADVHVLPFFLRMVVSLNHFKSYEVPKEKFSRLLDWFDVCSERESVRAAGKSEEEIIKVYRRFVEVDYSFGGLNKNKK